MATLHVRDFLGLAEGTVDLPGEERLVVWPEPGELPLNEPRASGEGEVLPTRRRQRSEELLEVRKYYPGDDFRRINWKVFAHMNELFVRIGEENPPPEARFSLIFEPSLPLSLPGALGEALNDERIASLLALVVELDRRGREVRIFLPGQPTALKGDERSRGPLLTALAGLSASLGPQPWVLSEELQSTRPLVFAAPGSPGLTELLGLLKSLGQAFLVEYFPWPYSWKVPPAPQKTPFWKVRETGTAGRYGEWMKVRHIYEKAWFESQGGRHD